MKRLVYWLIGSTVVTGAVLAADPPGLDQIDRRWRFWAVFAAVAALGYPLRRVVLLSSATLKRWAALTVGVSVGLLVVAQVFNPPPLSWLDPGTRVPVVFGGVSVGSYLLSLQRHAEMNCRSCKGLSKHTGLFFVDGRRPCEPCWSRGTPGREPRAGTRIARFIAKTFS